MSLSQKNEFLQDKHCTRCCCRRDHKHCPSWMDHCIYSPRLNHMNNSGWNPQHWHILSRWIRFRWIKLFDETTLPSRTIKENDIEYMKIDETEIHISVSDLYIRPWNLADFILRKRQNQILAKIFREWNFILEHHVLRIVKTESQHRIHYRNHKWSICTHFNIFDLLAVRLS